MVPYGKAFTDPFFLLVVATAGLVLFARLRTRKDRRSRFALTVALALTLATGALGTDAAVRVLERSLVVDRQPGRPALIVVPSAGSRGDVLTTASAERVHAAVEWWQVHRRASLVMSGADTIPGGQTSARTVRLMKRMAMLHGVPENRILVEARSRNTRVHPVEVLRLRGVERSTSIGVVTSATHMRRARREFLRHFDTVVAHPVRPSRDPLHAGSFIPSSESLNEASRALHEWLGIAWYALRS